LRSAADVAFGGNRVKARVAPTAGSDPRRPFDIQLPTRPAFEHSEDRMDDKERAEIFINVHKGLP
jgi:hypothetical protein